MQTFTKLLAIPLLGRRWAGVGPALLLMALLFNFGRASAQMVGHVEADGGNARPARVPLGTAARFGLLSGGPLAATASVVTRGQAGGGTVSDNVRATDGLLRGETVLAQAQADLRAARAYAAGLAGQAMGGSLDGLTLKGGVYAPDGAVTLGAGALLTLAGDSNSVFVFNIEAGLTLGQNSTVRLLNVRPANVYWVVRGPVTAWHNASLSGLVLGADAIALHDTHRGTCGLLTTGDVRLDNLDPFDGTNVLWSANALGGLPAPRNVPPFCVLPTCSLTGMPLLNGSFETAFPACVNRLGSIDLTNDSQATCWRGSGSPDWFSTCADRGLGSAYGVPNNVYTGAAGCGSPQPALPGSVAYAGIYSREAAVAGGGWQQQRETLLQQFTFPLQRRQRYYVAFAASLAAVSSQALRTVQLGFLPAMPAASTGVVLPNVAVALSSGTLGSTTAGWTQVSGSYTATGTEQVLALGNFNDRPGELLAANAPACLPDAAAAAAAGLTPPLTAAQGAYYFIDEVSVVAFPQAGPLAGADSRQCGAPARLGFGCPLPATANATYTWTPATGLSNPDILNPTAAPSVTTTYTLTVRVPGQPDYVTSTVVVVATSASAGAAGAAQAIVCPGPVQLEVLCANPDPNMVYTWTNSATGQTTTGQRPTVPVSVTTTFVLTARLNGQNVTIGTFDRTTVTVLGLPDTPPLPQDIDCGGSLLLRVPNPCPGVVYSWLDGATGTSTTGTTLLASPTVPSTTYTLRAALNGITLPTTLAYVVTVNQGRPCCPAQNYFSNSTFRNPGGGNNYFIGTADRLTYIRPSDFGGGPLVFNGTYRVRGPVVFEGGNFALAPGTVFYVDGGNSPGYPQLPNRAHCYADVLAPGGSGYLQLFVGRNATLLLDQAILTTNCEEMWGGVELVNNGFLRTRGAQVSHARVGVLAGSECQSVDAQYELLYSYFVNDTYGVVVQGNNQPRAPRTRTVQGCSFYSRPAQRLIPDDGPTNGNAPGDGYYTSTDLVLHGGWHDGLRYTENHFFDVYNGAEVAGSNDELRLTNNQFYRNYGAAVVVGNPTAYARVGTVVVADNEITLPDEPSPGGQVVGVPVVGIRVMALPNGGESLRIEGNDVGGQSGRLGVPGKDKIGLDAHLSFDSHYVQRQNLWSYLDVGVRVMDAGANTSQVDFVTDNYFLKNTRSVVLTGGPFALFTPAISCNTFEGGSQGIAVEPRAEVGYLAGPENPALPIGFEPCANNFQGLMEDVSNDGSLDLYYLFLDNSNNPNGPTSALERPNFGVGTSAIIPLPAYGTSCDKRPVPVYGAGQYGLNNRPSAGTAPNWPEWEEIIASSQQSDHKLRELTLRLISYREKNQQWADLEAFGTSLAFSNTAAFECISLYLMERYRRLGQDEDAQRVRDDLVRQRGQDAEISQRVAYFDVAGRLRHLAPGTRPVAADSAVLAQVAGSEAAFAPVACATLRYFYPSCPCAKTSAATVKARPSQRPAGSGVARKAPPVQMQAYPNPAHERVAVTMTGTCPAGSRLELLEIGTGRALRSVAVTDARAELSVAGLAAGVYAGRAVSAEGRVLGTCKIVVIH